MADRSALRTAYGRVRRNGVRYSLVSVVNVLIGQSLLYTILHWTPWLPVGATTANVLAVSLSAVPAYYLSRWWVWGKRGRSELAREVLPFWGFALAGLVLSTISVTVAAYLLEVEPGTAGWRSIVPNLANLASFGALWVVKFFVLDQLVFASGSRGAVEDDSLLTRSLATGASTDDDDAGS